MARTTNLQRREGYGGGGAIGPRALTSLNSWIWACSNMEKTLEEPRWACLVAAALPRVPAFLLACNTVSWEGSSPGIPRDAPMCTPEHSEEGCVRSYSYPGDHHPGPEAQKPLCFPTPKAALQSPDLALTIVWGSLVSVRGPQPPLCVSLITWSTK